MSEESLGQLLVRERLMTPKQLETAVEFQRKLGGELGSIVVKLGYVKDTDLAHLVAQEEHVATSLEINEDVIDFKALQQLPRALLEKHQVVPLRSDGQSLVLAMADPNNLNAIEEIQFLVNRMVEPAVATVAAIRKALNNLDELIERHQERGLETAEDEDQDTDSELGELGEVEEAVGLEALASLPLEKLLRAYILTRVERGELSAAELLARANRL